MSTRDDDRRLADSVYRSLVDRLISQEIEPGARMSIDGLSRDLEVSQTPVRQALAQLETEGLVTRVHLAGYRAAPLMTWQEFDQLFQMRLLLEPFAAGVAAAHRTGEQMAEMEHAERELRELSTRNGDVGYGVFARGDARLHDAIATASGNPFLAQAQVRLHAHVHLFRLPVKAVSGDALGEHEELLAAIAEGDEEGATRVMRRHLRAARARLFTAFAGETEAVELERSAGQVS